jgi:hypothetical protein
VCVFVIGLSPGMQPITTHNSGLVITAGVTNEISAKRKLFRNYKPTFGLTWVRTMKFGLGLKVHLAEGELPMGGRPEVP